MDLDEEEYKATKEFYKKKREKEKIKNKDMLEENYKHIPYIE